MSNAPRRFVVTVDDPGGLVQDLAVFDRVRRFFDSEDVPASFMVVPRGEGGWQLDMQPEWLAALHAAEADGHDCQLHGLDHWNCEFGPYHERSSAGSAATRTGSWSATRPSTATCGGLRCTWRS